MPLNAPSGESPPTVPAGPPFRPGAVLADASSDKSSSARGSPAEGVPPHRSGGAPPYRLIVVFLHPRPADPCGEGPPTVPAGPPREHAPPKARLRLIWSALAALGQEALAPPCDPPPPQKMPSLRVFVPPHTPPPPPPERLSRRPAVDKRQPPPSGAQARASPVDARLGAP